MSALSRLLVLLLGLQVSGLQVPAACTRRAVLLPAAASLAYLRQSPARAADADKKFEKCLADCVYEATKIAKGLADVEVISRADAFATCKPECRKKNPKPK